MKEECQFSAGQRISYRILFLLFFIGPWHANAQVDEWNNVPGFVSTIITIEVTSQFHVHAGPDPSNVSESAIQTLFVGRLQTGANFHKSTGKESFRAVPSDLMDQQAIYNGKGNIDQK